MLQLLAFFETPIYTKQNMSVCDLRTRTSPQGYLLYLPPEPMLGSSALDASPPEGERQKRRLMPLRVTEPLINRVKHLVLN